MYLTLPVNNNLHIVCSRDPGLEVLLQVILNEFVHLPDVLDAVLHQCLQWAIIFSHLQEVFLMEITTLVNFDESNEVIHCKDKEG